jgi:hypothetical protein
MRRSSSSSIATPSSPTTTALASTPAKNSQGDRSISSSQGTMVTAI